MTIQSSKVVQYLPDPWKSVARSCEEAALWKVVNIDDNWRRDNKAKLYYDLKKENYI